MHYLTTDEQTINDLGIFGKAGKASVFDIYNKTVTQGGSALLATLFRHPLSDKAAIGARAALYRFFSQGRYSFPVDSTTAGTVAYYLENDDVRTQLQGGKSLSQKMKSMVAADADEVFVEDGVKASIRLLHSVQQFLQQLSPDVDGSGFEEAYNILENALSEPCFQAALSHHTEKGDLRLNGIILAELDKSLRFTYREQMLALLDRLYDLDVYIAVGQTAKERGFHFAEVTEDKGGGVRFEGLYHPQVENAIANDLELSRDSNILFLTGANMAGKSTLMKSIGIALYLAHMGFPVAAESMRFSIRDGILTSINLADNLTAGASHYYAEVLRVKEAARQLQSGKKLFVIFDELFRGTNVKDAYDATVAVTRGFATKKDSSFIISTHIMEAGEELQKQPLGIRYQFLPTEMQGNTPVYTRILREGITADRQGMVIIENEGILEMLDKGLAVLHQ